jgi:hypothetical protein
MPGQFKNTGTNPDGKLSLANVNDAGNFTLVKGPTPQNIVNVYARNQNAGNPGFDIQYFYTPAFGWQVLGAASNITSTSCAFMSTLGSTGISSYTFRIVRTGTNQTVLFDRAYSTSCPDLAALYCAESVALTDYGPPINIAFTVQVVGVDYVNCP